MIAGVPTKIKPGRGLSTCTNQKKLPQPVHAEFFIIGLNYEILKVSVLFSLFTVLKLPLTGWQAMFYARFAFFQSLHLSAIGIWLSKFGTVAMSSENYAGSMQKSDGIM